MTFKGHGSISRLDGSTEQGWATFVCGHCNTKVSGAVVAAYSWTTKGPGVFRVRWVLCTNCARGSAIDNDEISPGVAVGPQIQGLPSDVKFAYQEARRCIEVNSLTGAELICRKLLMHIAVDKGAKEGEEFVSYLNHLEKEGYVTPPMKKWVDMIRKHGNAATHKLPSPSRERAESTVMFTAELLRLTYEMEHLASKYGSNR